MGEKGNWKMIKWLLGMGYWVQGLRCFPWLAVIFYLKDSLKVDPSTLQILQNSAALPMVAKPLYGVVSDSFYFRAQHRLPYIALGGMLALPYLFILLLYFSGCFVYSLIQLIHIFLNKKSV